MHYYSKAGHLKYDYIVQPNSDYKQIQLQVKGASKIAINRKGELVITTPLGEIIEPSPLVIQNEKQLNAKWQIKNNIISFDIDNIDPSMSFIIDPTVCVRQWGTYYGGNGMDFSYSTMTDNNGNVYLSGSSQSSNSIAIATVGSYESSGTGLDCFLVKFNAAGVRLWGTYYGGSGVEDGGSCAVDQAGNVFLVGETTTNTGSVVATPGSFQPVHGGGGYDDFLVKFDANGVRLWATYYGGDGSENIQECSVDQLGNVYFVGATDTQTGTSIASPGCHQSINGGVYPSMDAFIVKFNNNGIRQWGTYYGGSGTENPYNSAVDALGNVYMCGETNSYSGTIIATPGSHQSISGGGLNESFLVKFNVNGVRQWGTFYGGNTSDAAQSCAVDQNNNVYLAGGSNSTSAGTIIATVGSHQSINGGGSDAYLAKFNTSGVRLWATYYGDGGIDGAYSCTTDLSNNVYLAGVTDLSTGTTIATPGSHQTVYAGGGNDGFVAKFDSNGVRQWGTYYGGSGYEVAYNCYVDASNNIYLAGNTTTNSPLSIESAGAYQPVFGGATYDAFLVKFLDCNLPANTINTTPNVNQTICESNTATLTATGSGTLNWYSSPSSTIVLNSGATFVTPTLSAGTYSYYVEAFTCATSTIRTEVTLTVNPSPTITVNSGSICTGQSFTILPSGANTYTISGGNTIVSPTISTTYSVTGTNSFGCINLSPAISNLSVAPLPLINVNSGTICSGQSFTIIPSGASTYTISGGNAIVSPTINTTYSITGTNTFGCTNSLPALCNITVAPMPTISVNSGSICVGQSFTINPSGAATYTYSSNTSIVSPTTNSSYTVFGTSISGCTNSAISNVTVNQLPNISIVSSNSLICFGQTAVLTAFGANSYTWNSSLTGSTQIVSAVKRLQISHYIMLLEISFRIGVLNKIFHFYF